MTINQIKINPYTLSITVRGLMVKEKGSPETFVSFEEIFLNLRSLSALRMALILTEIKLKQPYINIKLNEDMSFNFSDLIDKKEAKAQEKAKSTPLRFSLNNIQIENGSIDFLDGPQTDEAYCKRIDHWHSLSVKHSFLCSKICPTPFFSQN